MIALFRWLFCRRPAPRVAPIPHAEYLGIAMARTMQGLRR